MAIIAGGMGLCLIVVIMWETFEVIVLPRRVARRVRLTRLFYRTTWVMWSTIVGRLRSSRRQETYLSFYGPLSLLLLLSVWAAGMILGFALLQAALGSALNVSTGTASFGTDVYMSGTNFFTLGLGDVTPRTTLARLFTVVEAGTGFGFLALVIGYLPVMYQAFSRREVSTVLLDARAGSPPCAAELLRRGGQSLGQELDPLLREWERWSAELLESHISYPVLCYYRSQHSNQSWLAALTAILDTSALVLVGVDGISPRQAQLTFAIARHAIADLAQIFKTPPRMPGVDRLPPPSLMRLREGLAAAGVRLHDGVAADRRLAELRRMYEPYANALAEYLLMSLPPWLPAAGGFDSWQTSAWERISPGGVTSAAVAPHRDEHF
ncbi:MAG TPA: potassium channel family protein [Candidatus Methylomirabilis sp.]|nr:potassium channel family protein [Candidatus Methylomirabilis sp.]